MAVPFLFLSGTWFAFGGAVPFWMPVLFLAVYSVFFMATGLNQLTTGTVQGKLIRPDRRGRLMGVAGIVGSVVSITAAWLLLRSWLSEPDGGFGKIFAFTGCGMIAASSIVLLLRENPDTPRKPHHAPTLRSHFRKSLDVFREDRNFRCVAVVAMLFISLQLLFPHFQALGRERLHLESSGFQLMLWVIAQNAAVGLLSLLSGTIADRKGYRLAIRLQVFAAALTPLLALALAAGLLGDGRRVFWMSFCLLGLVPVTMRSLVNYTLELTEPERHPRYVATLSMCLFFPVLLAPLAGALIDWVGFESVFICISAVLMIGGFLTFGMAEPRHESLPEHHEATAQ
jgi:MFS family permease